MSRSSPPERFEYKIRLSPRQHCQIRAGIQRFMRLDPFSRSQPRGRYFVRSLYFDTADFQAYQEKMTGEANRIKLRLRSYAANESEGTMVKAELKTRRGVLVSKHAQSVSALEAHRFLKSRHWSEKAGPILKEFERLVWLKAQSPLLLVDYDREAWVPNDGSGVRVTFDHRIRFARSQQLFPAHAFFVTAFPQVVVMEIKFQGNQPNWLERLVRSHGLSAAPNSKYAWGVEQTQPALKYN